jgi:hypothetical protein
MGRRQSTAQTSDKSWFDCWQRQETLSSPKFPDRLGPNPFLFNKYRGGLGMQIRRGVILTTHFCKLSRLRLSGAILPLPHVSSLGAKGLLYFTIYMNCD